MPSSPEVTVVIPTRNRSDLLSTALRASLGQEDVDLEVIVVDDGSTDATAAQLTGLDDPRLRVLRNEVGRGVAHARNRGVAEARGEWLAFLDDDDIWSPRKLRTQLSLASSERASFVYSAGVVVDARCAATKFEAAPDPGELTTLLLTRNPLPAGSSNVVTRTDLVRRVGGFDEQLFHYADWDLWLRLTSFSRAAASSELLVGYVEHAGAMHLRDLEGAFREADQFSAKHPTTASGQGVQFDGLACSRWIARAHRRNGRRLQAARAYLRGAVAYRNAGNLARAVKAMTEPHATGASARSAAGVQFVEPDWLELYRR